MRTLGRLLAGALGLFIAGMSLPAHAQDNDADYMRNIRQVEQFVQRFGAIERRLEDAFEACDRQKFDRALVELRVLQDVVEGVNRRRIREYQALREEAKRVGARESVWSEPLDERRMLSFAGYLRIWQERSREFVRRCGPRTAQSFDPSRNHVSIFVEGGATFGHSSFRVDPGAFVPVEETPGIAQLHGGFGFQFVMSQIPVTDFANPALAFGANFRGFFGDGAQRSFNNGLVSGDVRQTAQWAATGYIGFPQVINQPLGLPFVQTLIITPNVGITYQEETLRSAQTSVGITNIFEKTFGRTGATVGLNFEVPAGNFNYGLITGLTMLPSTTVNGTSSLGLPAQAKIDSQANFFVGGRVGVNLTDFQTPRTYRLGPGFRF